MAIIQRGLLTLNKNSNLVLADFYFGQILRIFPRRNHSRTVTCKLKKPNEENNPTYFIDNLNYFL